MDKDIFFSKTVVWKNLVHTIIFLVKLFFNFARYLKRSNETPTYIENRLGILTSVLMAIDSFRF